MNEPREIRFRQVPEGFRDGNLYCQLQPIYRLGDVGKWSMVRAAKYPNACPFVMSRKEWNKLPLEAEIARISKGEDR